MAITTHTIRQLKRLSPGATAEVLHASFPMVMRMARGLTTDGKSAAKVIRTVMAHAAKAASKWHHEDAPHRWFLHHTLLATRRYSKDEKTTDNDPLIALAQSGDPEYSAFIRALRALPQQHREAFLLAHGEGLNDRSIGVAMDLSNTAADTHLSAATRDLRQLADAKYDEFVNRLKQAYRHGISEEVATSAVVDWAVTRYIVPRRVFRIVLILAMILIGLLLIVGGWEFWKRLDLK